MFVHQMIPVARQRLATVEAEANLSEIARLLALEHINVVVVCDRAGTMIGVVDDSDIVRSVGACAGGLHHSCVAHADRVMTGNVVSCRTSDSVREVWTAMKEKGLRHVPIVDELGKPIGVVGARDVLRHLLEEAEWEEGEMRDYFLRLGFH